jgi:hypothetical protein
MSDFDPEALRARAGKLVSRAKRAAAVFAVLGFAVGAPLGGVAAAGVDGLRRLETLQYKEDVGELVHSDDKRGEVLSILRHVPMGVLAFGVLGALVGLAFGLERALVLRVQGETALCLLSIEANTRK